MIRRLFRPLHAVLERYCSRRVGRWCMNRQNKVEPNPEPGFWFKVASRLEFRLRYFCYPDAPRQRKS